MEFPATVLFAARSFGGKSTLMKYLVFRYLREWDWIVIISPTAAFNHEYDWIPERYRVTNYEEGVLTKLLAIQERDQSRLLLIVDDGLGSIDFKSQVWLRLATTARQYRISLFIASQFLHRVPNHLRANTHYVCALKCTNDNEKKVLMNEYRIGLSKAQFEEMLEDSTHDYGALLINNRSSSTKPEDVYTRIRADIRLGRGIVLNY